MSPEELLPQQSRPTASAKLLVAGVTAYPRDFPWLCRRRPPQPLLPWRFAL